MKAKISKYGLRLVKEDRKEYELEVEEIIKPEDARRIFVETMELNNRTEEVLAMLTVSARNSLLGAFEVSVGSLSRSISNPREIYKRAILQNAAGIILGHNHPSGATKPSSDDIEITKKVSEAGDLLGITLHDHIIIGGDEFISLRAEGYL
ncbi:JAB domain-containing protein [Halarsenatibacter silvermanii]|uniref:DNA repair protein RadC n=1 Tax=Halarsenatibacter silvermanii TaxID=321763 RepID=A0A1G9RUV9_9FIRM|nr:JAB domain-containing protein [Halarsenatibacter silvermanii]SDM27026.1 DNA repair protein RadC [Halarsenatibacter silvermanii]